MQVERPSDVPIARHLSGNWRAWAALAVAVVVVVADLLWHPPRAEMRRGVAAAIGCAIVLVLARGDRFALGIRLRPVQGFWYWVKAALIVGGLLGVVVAIAAVVMHVIGKPLDTQSMFTDARQFRAVAVHAVVVAPLLEEPIYRLLVCVPIVAVLGRWPAIGMSGAVFAYLHFQYGNPGPDNFFAGYVLAWAYLHSRSLVVPIVMHALGNGFVIAGHIAAFYLA